MGDRAIVRCLPAHIPVLPHWHAMLAQAAHASRGLASGSSHALVLQSVLLCCCCCCCRCWCVATDACIPGRCLCLGGRGPGGQPYARSAGQGPPSTNHQAQERSCSLFSCLLDRAQPQHSAAGCAFAQPGTCAAAPRPASSRIPLCA